MITCSSCGQQTGEDTQLCPRCGEPLSPSVALDRTLATGSAPLGDGAAVASGSVPPSSPPSTDHDHTIAASEVSAAPGAGAPPSAGGPLEIGQKFGDRYTISRLLGVGGMGAVYEAYDETVGTRVALKVVRLQGPESHELTLQLDRRFKRELLLARQVTHKNVVRIHDLGEIDGIKYITMSYIEGSGLDKVLDRRGRLPVSEALPIIRGVLSGLVEAH
jgi:hypothetical protein